MGLLQTSSFYESGGFHYKLAVMFLLYAWVTQDRLYDSNPLVQSKSTTCTVPII